MRNTANQESCPRRIRTLFAAVLLLASLSPLPLSAQEPAERAIAELPDTIPLEEIVVTATPVPRPQASVAAPVTVITGEELRARGIQRVGEALRSVPALQVVRSGSFGATTSIFLRGGESDYVQVLIDGAPVNMPGGRFDFATLSTDNIARIEIVRGPVSVLYGSDAVSGVVQIFTREGHGEPHATLRVRGGSYDTFAWDANLYGGSELADYSFSVSRFATDGIYAFNSDFRNTVLSGLVQVSPSERTRAQVSLRYSDSEAHSPTNAAGEVVDRNAFRLADRITLVVDASHFFTDWFEGRVLIAANEVDAGFEDLPDSPADTVGFTTFRSLRDIARRSAEVRLNFYPLPATVLTAGIEAERQEVRRFDSTGGAFDEDRGNTGYYAQVLTDLGDRLSLNAGVRVDDNEAFGTFTTYRAGAVYALPTGTRLRAAYGTGFKEPTFFQNFASGFVRGNPNLEPERSRSWEVGIDQEFFDDRLFLSATYFDQRFEDLIQFTFTPPEPDAPNFFNVPAANADGVELVARWAGPRGLSANASYTYLDTEVTDAGFASGPGAALVEGEELLRRPKHSANVQLRYQVSDGTSVSVGLNYVGEREDRDFATFPPERVVLDSYTTVDLAARYRVFERRDGRPGLTVQLRIDNALDEEYVSIANFEAPGRSLFVGAQVGFGL